MTETDRLEPVSLPEADQALEPASSQTERQLALIESITGDSYVRNIRHFTNWIRAEGVALTADTVAAYFVALNKSAYAANTKIIRRQAVKKRLRQLFRAGGLGSTVAANLEQFLADLDREPATKAPQVATRVVSRSKYLARDQYEACLAGCGSERQRLFFTFLWQTGVRVSELCGIRLSDLRKQGEVIRIRITGKGNKERFILVRPELVAQARAVFGGATYLFETSTGRRYLKEYISSEIAKVSKRALGRAYRAHTLRHSFATRKIAETRKMKAVSRYLGHASTAVTLEMYTHEQLEIDELLDD